MAPALVFTPPLLYLLLVSLALPVVAILAQGLKVRAIEEPVTADRPRDDVIHAGCGLNDSIPIALCTQRMFGAECLGQLGPPGRVVG